MKDYISFEDKVRKLTENTAIGIFFVNLFFVFCFLGLKQTLPVIWLTSTAVLNFFSWYLSRRNRQLVSGLILLLAYNITVTFFCWYFGNLNLLFTAPFYLIAMIMPFLLFKPDEKPFLYFFLGLSMLLFFAITWILPENLF